MSYNISDTEYAAVDQVGEWEGDEELAAAQYNNRAEIRVMKLTTKKMELARQLAGPALPEGAEIAGLILESDDGRNQSALVLIPRTGLYVSMIGGAERTIDQRVAHFAVAQAERGSKAKTFSAAERARRKKRLAAARKSRWPEKA